MASFIKIAHRGASGSFPENTRLAFENAIAAGVDMIEIDCQLTKDGHVVVFHDERLSRTAGVRGALKDKTLDQIKKLDVGQWRNNAYKGEKILTLEEVVELVGGRSDLCLDIKHYANSPPGIELKILFTLSHYGFLDRTIVASFDYRCLGRVRELAPQSRLGVIHGATIKEDPFQTARQLEAASIHVQKELATREFLDKAREERLDVHVWTVNELRDMEKFVSLGVQGLVSDFPERFCKLKWKSA